MKSVMSLYAEIERIRLACEADFKPGALDELNDLQLLLIASSAIGILWERRKAREESEVKEPKEE